MNSVEPGCHHRQLIVGNFDFQVGKLRAHMLDKFVALRVVGRTVVVGELTTG